MRLRDWLVVIMLIFASIQTVRADFLVSESVIDWHQYALGTERRPYQERIALMPLLRWAGDSPAFRHFTTRYAQTITVGSLHTEPITPEKLISMLVGILSMLATVAGATWFARRRNLRPWWLAPTLVVSITAVSTVVRATQNFWYPYDLPHMALFGLALVFGLEGLLLPSLLCYALDLPTRETSIFLLLLLAPSFFKRFGGTLPARVGLLFDRDTPSSDIPREVSPSRPTHSSVQRAATLKTVALLLGMLVPWILLRIRIAHRFAHNPSHTGAHWVQNLHDIALPHHWPQLFSAGGYLVLFIWLERRLLDPDQRLLLYLTLPCLVVVLYFGVWTETRVWLDWTLPLAIMGATEFSNRLQFSFGSPA